MGVKGTADATGNIFVLVLLFPIMIAKLMANKYHKDGFFGMIKATLAVLIAIGTIFVAMEAYKSHGITGGFELTIVDATKSKEYYTKMLEDEIKKNKSIRETGVTQDMIRWKNETILIADEKYKKKALETLMLAAITFVMFYLSIKLFISSSNRSRALANQK